MEGRPTRLVPLPGARNIRTLSARFIADMQTHWEKNGMSALDAGAPKVSIGMLRTTHADRALSKG